MENGGTLLTTYFTGVVDENYLAHLGPTPNGLTDVLGLRATDLDALYPGQSNGLTMDDKRYKITELCEIPADVTAKTVAAYESDFYAGEPCLTVNTFGKGQAWYLTAKVELDGLRAIYDKVLSGLNVQPALPDALPYGVVATARENLVFLQNYSGAAQQVSLSGSYTDVLTGKEVSGTFDMPVNGMMVLQK